MARRIPAAVLAASVGALIGACVPARASADASVAWPRIAGVKPADEAATPPGTRCSASLALDAGPLVLVCREPGRAGASLWSVRTPSNTEVPQFTRILRWAGAAGARLSWHRAPACPAGEQCIQGVLLADAFDDYCMGTTVLTIDATQRIRVAGRIPELIEVDGDPQCVGTQATLKGPAQRADISVALPLLRQTPAGLYTPLSPPQGYRLVDGKLLRERR